MRNNGYNDNPNTENNNENTSYVLQDSDQGYVGQTDINSDENKRKMSTATKVKIGCVIGAITVFGLICFSKCDSCNHETDSFESSITSVTTFSGNYIDGSYDDTSIEESTTKESSKTTTTSNTETTVTELSDLDGEPTVTTVPDYILDETDTTQTVGTTAPNWTWEGYVTGQTTTESTNGNTTDKSSVSTTTSKTTKNTTVSETTVPTSMETESNTKTKPTVSETSQTKSETQSTGTTGPTGPIITGPTGSKPPVTGSQSSDTKPSDTQPPVTGSQSSDTKPSDTQPPVTESQSSDTQPPVTEEPTQTGIPDHTSQIGVDTGDVFDPFAKKVFVKSNNYRYFWHK